MDILKTHDLCKEYKGYSAVNKVNITIKKGEIYGLIGMNGSGKTTLMKLITGLASKTSGHFELFSSKKLDAQRRKIGCVVETPALFGNMTAEQNLGTLMSILPENPRFDIDTTLKIVGLENTKSKKVRQFSLGMKQRLGLALALLGSPEFLILDEPINGLDPVGIKEFRNLIIELNQKYGLTIMISSHILSELFKVVTCYGIIANGKLIAELRSEDLEKKRLGLQELEEYLVFLMGGAKNA